jgi:uncharacterized membrane protein YdbT with pleckstrin-like domain
MPYPRRLLNEGEEVVLDLRPHWWYFAKHIAVGVPVLILFFVVVVETAGDAQRNLLWVWLVVALVWVLWLVVRYFSWTFTHFVVTTKRVVFRTGAFAKHGVEIPLDRISNINFNQTIIERIIGAGDLEIESAGRDGQSKFNDVRHPDAVQQMIYRQAEEHARTRAAWSAPQPGPAATPAPGAANPQKTIPEQIEDLASLRDRGLITAAEFDAKKAQLLERM